MKTTLFTFLVSLTIGLSHAFAGNYRLEDFPVSNIVTVYSVSTINCTQATEAGWRAYWCQFSALIRDNKGVEEVALVSNVVRGAGPQIEALTYSSLEGIRLGVIKKMRTPVCR